MASVDGVSHQEFCAMLGEPSRHPTEETQDIGHACAVDVGEVGGRNIACARVSDSLGVCSV